jgi:hypothetical protein
VPNRSSASATRARIAGNAAAQVRALANNAGLSWMALAKRSIDPMRLSVKLRNASVPVSR